MSGCLGRLSLLERDGLGESSRSIRLGRRKGKREWRERGVGGVRLGCPILRLGIGGWYRKLIEGSVGFRVKGFKIPM